MLELVIEQRRRDLGGFEVGRVLPWPKHRMVGPLVFFDHMGPVDFPAGIPHSVDVRLKSGTSMALPATYPERALYVVSGSIEAHGQSFHAGQMPVFTPRSDVMRQGADGRPQMFSMRAATY